MLKRTYAEPHWSSRQAAVLASETVSLVRGADRRRPEGPVRHESNPVEAREIFLRSALVEGQWRTRHHFFEDNQQLRAEAAELEERTRRRDLVVDDQVIYDFYDARVPADVTSGRALRPLVAADPAASEPDLLTMTMDDLVVADPTGGGAAFPDHWTVRRLRGGRGSGRRARARGQLPLLAWGSAGRGKRCTIPLAVLNQVDEVAVLLAGARNAHRAGYRADQSAAQGGPQDVRAGAGVCLPGAALARRPPGPRRRSGSRCHRPWPGPCAG